VRGYLRRVRREQGGSLHKGVGLEARNGGQRQAFDLQEMVDGQRAAKMGHVVWQDM
jgi:hypothetical protein